LDERNEAIPARKTRAPAHAIRFVSCLLLLLPPALALLYVRAFGVNVVFADAWSMVRLFDKWSSGTLQASDLFRQHVEHRMFFPKGAELLLGSITKYNNVAEMYLIQVCSFVTLIVLLLAFRESIFGGNIGSWLFLLVPVSLLVFSFRQHENMLWGFQISFAFTQAFGVLALFLLYLFGRKRPKKFAFLAALGSATIASFSMAQGLLVWPAGLSQLFISPLEKSAKNVSMGLWGLLGLGEWILYFAGYESRGDSSLLDALGAPLAGAAYFFDLLGGSLFWQRYPAFVGGLLLACLALVGLSLIHKDGRWGEHSFWVSLLFYSFLMLVAITLGRSEFGPGQALASRYTSFSILVVISVYAVLVKTALESRSRVNIALLVALSGVVLVSAAVSYSEGIKAGSKAKAFREEAAFTLITYESQPDEVLKKYLHPSPEFVRERASVLQSLGYNVFSEQ
jgi:hypothetical protein